MELIHVRLMRLETLLPQARLDFAFLDSNSTQSLDSWQQQPPSPPASLWNEAGLSGVQQYLTTLANSIFNSDVNKVTEENIYTAYFRNINKWLPIISQRKFCKQLTSDRTTSRRPEMDLLLMCMYLLVKDPSDLDPSEDLYSYYKSVRSAYFMLQVELIGSLELAQSGLMLASYEHASGLVEQAYATIWTCVRMVYSLRLQEKFQRSIDDDQDKQTERAEAHALWWAIIVRDR